MEQDQAFGVPTAHSHPKIWGVPPPPPGFKPWPCFKNKKAMFYYYTLSLTKLQNRQCEALIIYASSYKLANKNIAHKFYLNK